MAGAAASSRKTSLREFALTMTADPNFTGATVTALRLIRLRLRSGNGQLRSFGRLLFLVVFRGDVAVCVIRQQGGCGQADDGTNEDIESDRVAGLESRKQGRCDQRCGAAGEDRGQLIADRGAAVAQPAGEAFCDKCRLRPDNHSGRI